MFHASFLANQTEPNQNQTNVSIGNIEPTQSKKKKNNTPTTTKEGCKPTNNQNQQTTKRTKKPNDKQTTNQRKPTFQRQESHPNFQPRHSVATRRRWTLLLSNVPNDLRGWRSNETREKQEKPCAEATEAKKWNATQTGFSWLIFVVCFISFLKGKSKKKKQILMIGMMLMISFGHEWKIHQVLHMSGEII